MRGWKSSLAIAVAIGLAVGCDGNGPIEPPAVDTWQIVHEGVPGALLSVWGTGARDVWVVGADALDGTGPVVLHFDGEAWQRVPTGQAQGDLWWVFGFPGGPVYMGGTGGTILRYQPAGGPQDGSFTAMSTPGTGTVFGIWGAAPDDVWAVGGDSESAGGFAWRLRDPAGAWEVEPSVPDDVRAEAAIWKIFGTGAREAWAVGSNGVSLHWDGSAFSRGDTGIGTSLFTVHAYDGRYAAVGGTSPGFIVEHDGSGWHNVTPDPQPPMGLSGVTLGPEGLGIAVGPFGGVYVRDDAGWQPAELEDAATRQSLHGSWIDDEGGLWAAGGQTSFPPFNDGILLHRGAPVPSGDL